ncbi:MAG: DUF1573 domain-containing protein [Planctomycetaceae bacterium]
MLPASSARVRRLVPAGFSPVVHALLAVALLGPTASAQEWARKMFPVTSHNFGTVAKGSKTEYRFIFSNPYKETLHVSGVRTSCGCTSPVVTKRDLGTHETSEVIATFNTRAFLGQHGATLTVTFDRPFPAEVQLRVAGHIRGDVMFDPPFVDLGNVDLGKGVERKIQVSRVGATPWAISDVKSADSKFFEVVVSPPMKTDSKTIYDLTVKLKPDAPAGYVKGQLLLVTDDPRAPQIPMDVEGRVVAEVTVSPQLLALGAVTAGETVTKNVVVRANREFCITGVQCDTGCLSCEPKATPAKVHILPVTFQAGGQAGRIERQLKISTDLGEGAVPTVTVQVEVQADTGSSATPGQSASVR